MSQLKSEEFSLPLEVFGFALPLGIVSKDEVVAWADGLIQREEEPDYFFIEISLSRDINELLTILNEKISGGMSLVGLRVVLALIYKKFVDGKIDVDFAVRKVSDSDLLFGLTSFEAADIYEFEEYEFFETEQAVIKEGLLQFLSRYKHFELERPDQWLVVNEQLEATLKEEEAEAQEFRQVYLKRLQKSQRKRKLKMMMAGFILALLTLTVLVVDIVIATRPHGEFGDLWFLNIFAIYILGRTAHKLWVIRKRGVR